MKAMKAPFSLLKPRRRWLQYSLRTLLVATTLLAIACSWLAVKLLQARRQREAVVALEKLGGHVIYHWQLDAQGQWLRNPQRPGRTWLRGLLGDDLFQSVHTVELDDTQITDAGLALLERLSQLRNVHLGGTPITDVGLEHLKNISQLQYLFLAGTPVTDAGLEHLKGLSELQELWISDTRVTSAGLEHLKGLRQLHTLDLRRTQVTDAGLDHLKTLSQLHLLWLDDTKVTDVGVEKLHRELPNCDIWH
jgi:hypothetical protein